jgi:hypothetical protein
MAAIAVSCPRRLPILRRRVGTAVTHDTRVTLPGLSGIEAREILMEADVVELDEKVLEEVAGGADGGYYIVVQYGYPTYIDTGTSCKAV